MARMLCIHGPSFSDPPIRKECSPYCLAPQVLSVETALSIQSHPDKALAEKLHAERPDVRASSLSSTSSRYIMQHVASHTIEDTIFRESRSNDTSNA